MHASDALQDASRAMQVCNACRYCEGFCAVFPAMERRREFSVLDLAYLANLCHSCLACFYACQYAPPHPFNVNLPRTLTDVRAETWETYAWPGFLAGLFRRNGTVVALATALGIALLLLLTAVLRDPAVLYGVHTAPGAFYLVIPAWAMVSVASVTFTFSILALVMGAVRFWRGTASGPFPGPAAWGQALRDVASLRYLGGGGDGWIGFDPHAPARFDHALLVNQAESERRIRPRLPGVALQSANKWFHRFVANLRKRYSRHLAWRRVIVALAPNSLLVANGLSYGRVVAEQLDEIRNRGGRARFAEGTSGLGPFPSICGTEFLDVCSDAGRTLA